MEANAKSLDEIDVIKQFIELMEQQNQKESSQDFVEVLRYVAGMQLQLGAMVGELQSVREQLAQMQDSEPMPVRATLVEKIGQLEEKVAQLSGRFAQIKNHLTETVTRAVNTVKDKGIQAMNQILQKGISGVRKPLESCQEKLSEVLIDSEKTANQIDSIGDELKQIGNSAANVGRLLSGRGTKEVSDEKQGVALTRIINMPVKKRIAGLQKNLTRIERIFEKLDKISARLEPDKGKEERVSVKDKLSQMKVKSEQQKKQPEKQKVKSKEEIL